MGENQCNRSEIHMDENSTTYTTASGVWRRGGVIKIASIMETPIASFPLDFVRDGGDNTWRYISYVVGLLVEVDPSHPGHIEDENGAAVVLNQAPPTGLFRYIEQGISNVLRYPHPRELMPVVGKTSDVILARGPQYFSSVTAPSGIEESTRSASSKASRSRPDQVSHSVSTRY
jgi:hypothetical protein